MSGGRPSTGWTRRTRHGALTGKQWGLYCILLDSHPVKNKPTSISDPIFISLSPWPPSWEESVLEQAGAFLEPDEPEEEQLEE